MNNKFRRVGGHIKENGHPCWMPFLIETESEPSRDRTYDPQIKSLLLYQLSYRPIAKKLTACLIAVKCVKGRPLRL